MKSGSRLEKVLTAGEFAVTAELGPPQNANPEAIKFIEFFEPVIYQVPHAVGLAIDFAFFVSRSAAWPVQKFLPAAFCLLLS